MNKTEAIATLCGGKFVDLVHMDATNTYYVTQPVWFQGADLVISHPTGSGTVAAPDDGEYRVHCDVGAEDQDIVCTTGGQRPLLHVYKHMATGADLWDLLKDLYCCCDFELPVLLRQYSSAEALIAACKTCEDVACDEAGDETQHALEYSVLETSSQRVLTINVYELDGEYSETHYVSGNRVAEFQWQMVWRGAKVGSNLVETAHLYFDHSDEPGLADLITEREFLVREVA